MKKTIDQAAFDMFKAEFEAAKGDPEKESKFGAALASTLGSGPAMLLISKFVKGEPLSA